MRLRFTLVLGAFAAAAALAGSTSASGASLPPYARYPTIPTFTYGLAQYVTTLDPAYNQGTDWYGMLDNLVRFNSNGTKLQPWLAQSVTQPGPAVYVYHLRHGVKFWDGNEMTSADVANALNYYRYPQFQTSTYYRSVKSITTPDKYTVVVTLKHRDASWPSQMAWQGNVFEKAFQQAHKNTFGKPGTGIMGTGAFKLDSFDPNSGFNTSANTHWWNGRVNVQHFDVKFFGDETSMALAFRAGAIDMAETFDAQAFASTAHTKLLNTPAFTEAYFGMNYQQAPFNNIHVRRAIAYAIDKNAIIKAVGSPAVSVPTLIPPSQLQLISSKAAVDALIKSLPQYPFDLAKAKAELKQSPYPNGFTTHTDTLAFGAFVNICQALSQMLAKIGIDMKVNVIGATQWVAEVYGAKTYPTMFTTVTLPSPDPSSYPSFMLGSKGASNGGGNFANYNRPSIDVDIRNGVQSVSNAKRFAAYSDMVRSVATDVPYIPIYLQDDSIALQSKFSWPTFNFYTLAFGPWALLIKPNS
jgi:peptide/nickel transport system substrate-binding protein